MRVLVTGAHLVPRLMVHGLRGGSPPLVSPNIARDLVHANDVIEGQVKTVSVATPELDAVYRFGTGVQSRMGMPFKSCTSSSMISAEPTWSSMETRL